MSRIIIPDVATVPLNAEQADIKAELCRRAEQSLGEAGQGLAIVHQHCEAGTATAKDIYFLIICQGYVNDALAALTEREHSTILAS